MTTTPTFSIITATYNAGKLLNRTTASLGKQTFRDFEWLVIDGASGDDTLTKVRAAGDLVSHCISERDEGIADAWNKGLAVAKGANILILNAGDVYDANCLETMAQRVDGERIVCSHARLATEDGREAGRFLSQPHKLSRAMHLAHNWCAVPAQHYRTLGPYSKIPLAMDFDWFHRYYKQFGVQGFDVIDQALGTYYLGGASDVNYRSSFGANERILVAHGMSPITARFYRMTYTLKHALVSRIR